ncbi:MAG TPA: DUF5009 domain-containing protein [Cyclobacteriaceae bacterium]|nr:DUF5009 domain-containing protein [Cyclobacteriaceae bacterium]
MYNTLTPQRILSIDALRGLTILVMIFVNEVAGVSGMPQWMQHMPAEVDGMTYVDVVFPAFLFIVGMSIPFAINKRLAQGERQVTLQKHILFRTAGLLVLGVFMVNADDGNEAAMVISIPLWSLLFYAAMILGWNEYKGQARSKTIILRFLGFTTLIILTLLFRGGNDGTEHLQPKWWGILGLIGWAYLFACTFYQISAGNKWMMGGCIIFCITFYILGKSDIPVLQWMSGQTGHAVHTMIVLCGVVLTLIFFDLSVPKTIERRYVEGILFVFAILLIGYILRPYYTISKIKATPTWGFYSAAICCVVFMVVYWIIDIRKYDRWTRFLQPAAANPLLTYIIPSIVYAFMKLTGLAFPSFFYDGITGVIWAAVYVILVMSAVRLLNEMNVKLQL